MKNPTPFILAEEAKWKDNFLPARVYLKEGMIPTEILPNSHRISSSGGKTNGIDNPYICGRCGKKSTEITSFKKGICKVRDKSSKIIITENINSGFSGILVDSLGRYAGSIRKSIERQ